MSALGYHQRAAVKAILMEHGESVHRDTADACKNVIWVPTDKREPCTAHGCYSPASVVLDDLVDEIERAIAKEG